jgi:hypothetical protein
VSPPSFSTEPGNYPGFSLPQIYLADALAQIALPSTAGSAVNDFAQDH